MPFCHHTWLYHQVFFSPLAQQKISCCEQCLFRANLYHMHVYVVGQSKCTVKKICAICPETVWNNNISPSVRDLQNGSYSHSITQWSKRDQFPFKFFGWVKVHFKPTRETSALPVLILEFHWPSSSSDQVWYMMSSISLALTCLTALRNGHRWGN